MRGGTQNFPASWENTGKFVDPGSAALFKAAKKGATSVAYEPIPYASEQGIFRRLQGIESGDHGIFWPDQGRGGRDPPPWLSCLAVDHRRTLGPTNLSGRVLGSSLNITTTKRRAIAKGTWGLVWGC